MQKFDYVSLQGTSLTHELPFSLPGGEQKLVSPFQLQSLSVQNSLLWSIMDLINSKFQSLSILSNVLDFRLQLQGATYRTRCLVYLNSSILLAQILECDFYKQLGASLLSLNRTSQLWVVCTIMFQLNLCFRLSTPQSLHWGPIDPAGGSLLAHIQILNS